MTRTEFERNAARLLDHAMSRHKGGDFILLMPMRDYWSARFGTGYVAFRNGPEEGDIEALKRILRPEFSDLVREAEGVTFMGYPCVVSEHFPRVVVMEKETGVFYWDEDEQE